ncbi:pyrroline-5-carboxylate reductase family protein, partial [Flagellimonas beolgyonensis]
PQADMIFVAVKPHHSKSLFEDMAGLTTKGQIIISIMAGVSIDFIRKATGLKKIVRAMPNLPAQVGKGLTSYIASDEVSRIESLTIED